MLLAVDVKCELYNVRSSMRNDVIFCFHDIWCHAQECQLESWFHFIWKVTIVLLFAKVDHQLMLSFFIIASFYSAGGMHVGGSDL